MNKLLASGIRIAVLGCEDDDHRPSSSPQTDDPRRKQKASLEETMRLCWCITIGELNTFVCGIPLRNREVCAVFGIGQLMVACASLLQYLAYDIIIFDYGLMHRVLGTNECVANYLDGGFMRAMWCVEHSTALFIMLIALYIITKPTWVLWPALLMQSSYALGLAVLTMATAPKILEAFGGRVTTDFTVEFCIFATGFVLNWLFTFVLWHHYWHMERKYTIRTVLSS